jgi:hypothetical protein
VFGFSSQFHDIETTSMRHVRLRNVNLTRCSFFSARSVVLTPFRSFQTPSGKGVKGKASKVKMFFWAFASGKKERKKKKKKKSHFFSKA